MYSKTFVVQQTAMIEQELLKYKLKYGEEFGEPWLDGATLFAKEVLPLIMLKYQDEDKALAMVDGLSFIANHTAWLLELQKKDWTDAKG